MKRHVRPYLIKAVKCICFTVLLIIGVMSIIGTGGGGGDSASGGGAGVAGSGK